MLTCHTQLLSASLAWEMHGVGLFQGPQSYQPLFPHETVGS